MNWNGLKVSFLPKKEIQSQDRKSYLDVLKIIAAFLTVFYHFAYYKLDYGFDLMQEAYFPNFNRIVMCFASCCVPVFFMVNGTLLFGKQRSWKNVYVKALKILVLTTVWSLIGFPSWFFKTLIVLYILFPIFQYMYTEKRWMYSAIILMVLVFPFGYNAIILILKMTVPDMIIHVLGRTVVIKDLSVTGLFTMYSIYYFLIGPVLASKKVPTIYGVVSSIAGLGLVVFECVSYTVINRTMYDGVNAAFPTYGALLLSLGLFIIAKNIIRKENKIVRLIKSQILSIYLMHMPLIHVTGRLFEFTSLSLPMAIIGTLAILLLCTGVGQIVRRVPIFCWFVRI